MDNPTLWRDTIEALRFFSRLPLPVLPGETDPHRLPEFARLIRVIPLAGLILGGLAGLVAMVGAWIWPPLVAAVFCVGAAIVMTGAFHEDGLADTADSFGGMTREKRLDIMKDSRIGTFGASALIVSLGLRIAAISSLLALAGPGKTALALAASGALSRTVALLPALRLPPARVDGAAYATGAPTIDGWYRALLVAAGLSLLAWPAAGLAGVICGFGAAYGLGTLAVRFAERHVGGQTGDIAGATQQVAEIALLLIWLIFA